MSTLRTLIVSLLLLGTVAGLAISNDYYTHGSFPSPGSTASSASMRAELDLITAGFNKLPSFSGNANKPVIINGSANAMSVTAGTLALAGNFATTGAFNTTLIQGATVSLTLPLVNGTLASLAGTEVLTNKTINLVSNTLTGTTAQFNTALSDNDFATLAGSETLTTKTLNLTSNTLSGTTAQFNAALSDNDFATLAGSETLTLKTLTSPVLGGTISGSYTLAGSPTLTAASLSGTFVGTYTLAGTPTITAPAISAPAFSGTATGSLTNLALTTPTLTSPVMNTGVSGTAIASTAETQAGSSTTKVVTPGGLKGALGFSAVFASADQALSGTSNTITVAHGLGAACTMVGAYIRNTSAEFGYSIGDRIYIPLDYASGIGKVNISSDATNLYWAQNGNVTIVNRTTQAIQNITVGSWKLVVQCWL